MNDSTYRVKIGPMIAEGFKLGNGLKQGYGLAPNLFNLLTPNDNYSGRTAWLTSKCCILYIYSTNICTEYF